MLGELFKGVCARRFQQAVIGNIATDIGRNERFGREIRQALDHLDAGDRLVAGDVLGCLWGHLGAVGAADKSGGAANDSSSVFQVNELVGQALGDTNGIGAVRDRITKR